MANLSDVAKAAGVSVSTASFVLNGRAEDMRISSRTAERVLEAVRELGYVPNVAAKKLTSQADRQSALPDIAFLWSPSMHNSVLGSFVTNAQTFFDRGLVSRMNIIIAPFAPGHYREAGERFLNRHYNGLLFSPMFDEEIEFVNGLNLHIPFVVMHTEVERFSNVVVDNIDAGRLAAQAFAARGHRRAAMLYRAQIGGTSQKDERYTGFRDACETFGMNCIGTELPWPSFPSPGARAQYGHERAMEYLEKRTLPEAIFIQDDVVAVGFLVTLLREGVSIPEDIELITYGGEEPAVSVQPAITTVNYPVAGITLEALKLMSKQLGDPYATPERVAVPADITFRDSCPRPDGWAD